jgi:ADP-dependent NAD(P)H-hydrate dehydratase / NAD(P)H-hydrate epimerase
MQRVLPLSLELMHRELALFDIAHTRLLEKRAAASLPPYTLMARAGEATARLALALAPHARQVWIAAGPGNNGGDGLEAACHLQRWGKDVAVSLIGSAASLPADAREALVHARAAGVRIDGDAMHAPDLARDFEPGLAIDALLGIGASPPQAALEAAIRQLNALPCPVLAIDVPSGLNADTGRPLGTVCVTAMHTLTMIGLKPGLFTAAGRDHAGSVWLDTLGIDAPGDAPQAWLSGVRAVPARRHAQHKGSFGDVAVVGGSAGMGGAALLTARAAHAAGAGRVFVELLATAGMGLDALRPELMFRHGWTQSAPAVIGASTVVCGCGGGDAVRAPLPRLLSLAKRLVLDADALNALASDAALVPLLHARAGRGLATVLTPHPLEAARLLGCTTAEVQADRLQAAHALAARCRAIVVLKGSGSVIAAPGQTARINGTGNAALASAGTGDVLAGWLGGRWAQRGSGDEAATAFAVAVRAVAEHGAAAEPQPAGALLAGDLIERLHRR